MMALGSVERIGTAQDAMRRVGTARDVLRDVANRAARSGLLPQRAVRELQIAADIGGDLPLTLADVSIGMFVASQARPDDPPSLTYRRADCARIRCLIGFGLPDSPERLTTVLRAVERELRWSADREEAEAAATAAREAAEIEEAIGHETAGTLTRCRDRWVLQVDRVFAEFTGDADFFVAAPEVVPRVELLLRESAILGGARRVILRVIDSSVDRVGVVAELSEVNGNLTVEIGR